MDHSVTPFAHARREQDPEPLDTDFRRKYPPEALGREMEDGARVWKVYRDEATAHDTTTLEGWSKTLDILLIFAGLFSAVATAFIMESLKLLQLDSSAYAANALFAILNHTSPASAASLPPAPSLGPVPSSLSRWINGLWFTSLILALAVALLCILIKQWIGEYVARLNSSARNARNWARRHQAYFQGLTRWPVAELVAVLPLMLHLSLFLFIAGVVGFLWAIDVAIGIWVIVLGTGLTGFYIAAFLLPLWYPDAPTSTPLLTHARRAFLTLRVAYCQCQISALDVLLRTATAWSRIRRHVSFGIGQRAVSFTRRLNSNTSPAQQHMVIRSRDLSQWLRDCRTASEENIALISSRSAQFPYPAALLSESESPGLDADALKWLILSVPDLDAVAVGLQALGACGRNAPWVVALRDHEQIARIPIDAFSVYSTSPMHPSEVMRAVRAMLCLREHCVVDDPENLHNAFDMRHDLPEVMRSAISSAEQPDAALFAAYRRRNFDRIRTCAAEWLAASSPSLTSTVMILFQSHDISLHNALHILLCVHSTDLSATDWEIVLRYFRDCEVAKDSRIAITPTEHLKSHGPKELFCHATRFLDHLHSEEYAEALPLLSYTFCSNEFSWSLMFSAVPWILAYLRSNDFFLGEQSSAVLERAVTFLADAMSTEPDRTRYRAELLQTSASVLQVCESSRVDEAYTDTIVARCYLVLSDTFGSEVPPDFPILLSSEAASVAPPRRSYSHLAIDPNRSEVVLRVVYLVLNREPNGTGKSLLELLDTPGDKEDWWWLIDNAAAAFSAVWRRGEDVQWELHKLLSLLPLRKLLERVPTSDQFEEDDRLDVRSWLEQAVRIASHCVEMKPRWWTDGIDDILTRDITEDTYDRVLRLGINMNRVGPCTICPGIAPELHGVDDAEDGHI